MCVSRSSSITDASDASATHVTEEKQQAADGEMDDGEMEEGEEEEEEEEEDADEDDPTRPASRVHRADAKRESPVTSALASPSSDPMEQPLFLLPPSSPSPDPYTSDAAMPTHSRM